jgi:broad specificity phosphatase PhoE
VTTRILLVRHGETTLSADDRFAGSTDVPLSDAGRHQAECLAERLSCVSLDAVYCSPMRRTRETAAIVARPHGLEIVARNALREIDHGRWEQLRRADVEVRFPDEYEAWSRDPFRFAPNGGESGAHVIARAMPAVQNIVSSHPGETVLVVSHKATIRLIIAGLLGFDARSYRDRLDQFPACLNILDFSSPTTARLALFNDVSHYATLVST